MTVGNLVEIAVKYDRSNRLFAFTLRLLVLGAARKRCLAHSFFVVQCKVISFGFCPFGTGCGFHKSY